MKRRVFLRDPASQSQCIFCTHRLLASSHYIRRRPLHSSRAVSKPPGTASAPQKTQNDGEAYNSTGSTPSSQLNNGGPTSGSAPAASFGRPTFGGKPAFAAAAPNFGRHPTFGASGSSFGSSKPTFDTGGPSFGANKSAFVEEVPIFGGNPSFNIKPADGTKREAPSSNTSSEIKPTLEGIRNERALGLDNRSFAAEPAFRGKGTEGRGKQKFESNLSFGIKPTDGKGRETAPGSGSNLKSDDRPADRGTNSKPLSNYNSEIRPVFRGGREEGRRSPSFGNPNVSTTPAFGTERENQTSPSHATNSSFSFKPANKTKQVMTPSVDTTPSSDETSSFQIKPSPKAGGAEGVGSPKFGSKSTFGKIGSAPAFGSNVKLGSRPTFGGRVGAGAAPSFGVKPTFGGLTSSTAPQFTISGEAELIDAQEKEARKRIMRLAEPDKRNPPSVVSSSTTQGSSPYALPGEENFSGAQQKESTERRVPVNVFGGAGPENTRAGRPIPYEEGMIRRYASRSDRLLDENDSQGRGGAITANEDYNYANNKLRSGFPGRPLDTEFKTTRIESWSPNSNGPDDRTYEQSESWTHLKKRQQESSLNQQQARDKDEAEFVIARAEREKQAESRRYVPLVNTPMPNPRQDEYQRQTHSSIHNVYGQTVNNRGDQRHIRYPGLDQPGPKAYDPYAPLGKNFAPISPGDWRDEIPRRDDRLRRVHKGEFDSRNINNAENVGERNARYATTSGTGSSYDLNGRQQPSRESQDYSRHWDQNTEVRETTRSASNEYKSFRSSEDPRPSKHFSRGGYGSSRSEDPQRNESSSRGGFETPRSSEAPQQNKNTYRSSDVSRFSQEAQKPATTRESQRSRSTYEDLPKGKQKDKARRRQQFVDSFEEVEDEAAARAELKRQRKAEKAARKAAALTPILLPEWISVANLATALKVKLDDFVDKLENLGYLEMSHDHVIGAEDAGLIAQEYGFEPIVDRSQANDDLKSRPPAEDLSVLPSRPPVVTIMGHVDHGKTTLLDWLRKSSIVDSEHGGITQHIGAFSVSMPSGKIITFLDTPGHAAFLSMRQRGANVTDIIILVVAADDSVKPQTIEAINHAKAAKVPVIVAINKVDKEDSNIERVKQDLARHGVEVEDFGGDTQAVCVSGKTGQGMQNLEEAVITLSEILDMRAEKDGLAEGWVIEASLKSMGKVATVLVKRGTMRVGDFIVAGKTWARIRCMRNETGTEIEEASPGTPVEIDGWREQPLAGDEVLQATDESRAKRAVDYRLEKEEREKMAADMEAINESRKVEQEKRDREKLEAAIASGKLPEEEMPEEAAEPVIPGIKEIFFIVKGDVSGSVEAVTDSINSLGTKEVRARILRSGVGQLSEFDVEYAAAVKGTLINFNTDIDPNISSLAARNSVSILDHNIIYKLVDDVKVKLSEQLPPVISQTVTGEAEIAQIFDITIKGRKQKPIAGCKVRNGTINRASKVRVMRDGEKVFDGDFASLKNVKKDVLEMRKGTECGIGFLEWANFQVGDLIQCYEVIETKRYL